MSAAAVKGLVAAVLAIGGLAGGGVLAGRVKPEVETSTVGMSAAQHERIEQMASASLFGQFRSSMADFLWLKVDKYLHNGVDLRGLTPLEKEAQNADKVGSADKDWKHRGDETTVVPSRDRDWRGAFGDVEREVHPYQDMTAHTHRDTKEALPLFRLMTWSNPHFIAGYTVGASMIARDPAKVQEAVAFLSEGAKHNPENIEIETALGQILTARAKDYPAALPHLIRALNVSAARDRKTFSEDEDEAYQNAFRWLVLNRRESGDIEAAHRVAVAGLRVYPDDVVCRHFLGEYAKLTKAAR
jgi:hypothetical protein